MNLPQEFHKLFVSGLETMFEVASTIMSTGLTVGYGRVNGGLTIAFDRRQTFA